MELYFYEDCEYSQIVINTIANLNISEKFVFKDIRRPPRASSERKQPQQPTPISDNDRRKTNPRAKTTHRRLQSNKSDDRPQPITDLQSPTADPQSVVRQLRLSDSRIFGCDIGFSDSRILRFSDSQVLGMLGSRNAGFSS